MCSGEEGCLQIQGTLPEYFHNMQIYTSTPLYLRVKYYDSYVCLNSCNYFFRLPTTKDDFIVQMQCGYFYFSKGSEYFFYHWTCAVSTDIMAPLLTSFLKLLDLPPDQSSHLL